MSKQIENNSNGIWKILGIVVTLLVCSGTAVATFVSVRAQAAENTRRICEVETEQKLISSKVNDIHTQVKVLYDRSQAKVRGTGTGD